MRLYAPAKINWTLEALGRPDSYRGYHEVRTVMQTVEPCDSLDIGPANGLQLEVEGRRGVSEDDLILRAAAALDEGGGRGACIRVSKRIPVAAGLGGGSSDAAVALRGLNELWKLGHSDAQLAEAGAGLGADVPFFVYGGTGLAEGRGERVTSLPEPPPVWLVLLAPPFELPEKTKRMYAALTPDDFSDGSRTEALVGRIRGGGQIDDSGLYNVFERVAYEVFAGLDAYRDALLAAGARHVHLAGSGPALFALGADEDAARSVHARLRLPGGQAFVVRTLRAAEALRREG
jgi:4-diphosphocytidyl-2-C-methyl-D-erythritol kinase